MPRSQTAAKSRIEPRSWSSEWIGQLTRRCRVLTWVRSVCGVTPLCSVMTWLRSVWPATGLFRVRTWVRSSAMG